VDSAAINEGAAVLYAHIFHSVDVCGPSGSPLVSTFSTTVVSQEIKKIEIINKINFFILISF
jgi:hypothetical protein